MKRSTLYLSILALATLLFGWGIILVYRVFKASMTPSSCVCVVSPSSSEQGALAFKDFFERTVLEKGESLAHAVGLVQQHFPHCASVSCRQQPSGVVQARIELDEPFCAINDNSILTTRGKVVLRSVYADEALVGLPQVRIHDSQEREQVDLSKKTLSATILSNIVGLELFDKSSEVSPYLIRFLHHVPDSLLATHEVVYRSDDELSLVRRPLLFLEKSQIDTMQPTYLCAIDTVLDHDLLKRCDLLMADLEQQKTISKKKTRTAWVLDMRFDKQIILYPHMGGQVHG